VCELLGISSSIRIRPVPYFEHFRKRGREFPDGSGSFHGWGIALYPGGRKSVQLIKESIPANLSRLAKFLSSYERLRSRIFIAHIRRASRGAVAYKNTHPFCREAMGYEFAFCHNGTILNAKMLARGRFNPVGGTDSEKLFCSILDHVEKHAIRSWSEINLINFWDFLVEVNRRPSKNHKKRNKLNLLLTDGATLIAYSDLYGNGTLHILKTQSCEMLKALSDCSQDNGNTERYTVILATEPLDNDAGWKAMEQGELVAMRGGVIVFRSGRATEAGLALLGND
jgi:predicted glutamine amidotransferase